MNFKHLRYTVRLKWFKAAVYTMISIVEKYGNNIWIEKLKADVKNHYL